MSIWAASRSRGSELSVVSLEITYVWLFNLLVYHANDIQFFDNGLEDTDLYVGGLCRWVYGVVVQVGFGYFGPGTAEVLNLIQQLDAAMLDPSLTSLVSRSHGITDSQFSSVIAGFHV